MPCAYKPGDVLKERYLIKEIIGTGAMGEVYRAEHITLRKDVAIKLMHVHIAEKTQAFARFRREAKAAGKLDHPHICQVTDFDTTEQGDFYIVMEYLKGETLREKLDKEKTLDLHTIFRIMHDLLCALECAHDHGVVHRDIKPGNIMLKHQDDRDDFVKLIDFGIIHVDEPDDSHGTLTQSGQVYGTPQYLAPEQVIGGHVDFRADLYACGCMLFEMLEDHPPFNADNYLILLNKHLILEPPHLTTQVPCAQKLDEVIQKLLQKKPEDRFASARELRETLDEINDSLSTDEKKAKKTLPQSNTQANDAITLPSKVTIESKAVAQHESKAKIISDAQQVVRLHQMTQGAQKKQDSLPKAEPVVKSPTPNDSDAPDSPADEQDHPHDEQDHPHDEHSQNPHDEHSQNPPPRISALSIARGIVIVLLGAAIINMFWQQKQLQSKLKAEQENHFTQEQPQDSHIENSSQTSNFHANPPHSENSDYFVLTNDKIHEYAKYECRIASDAQLSGDANIRVGAESCLLGHYEEAYTVFNKVKNNYRENWHFDIMMALDTYAIKKYDEVVESIVKLFEIDPAIACDPAIRDIVYALTEEEEVFEALQTKLKLIENKQIAEGIAWLLLLTPCNHFQHRFEKLSSFYDTVDDNLDSKWLKKAVKMWRPYRTKGSCTDRKELVNNIVLPELNNLCKQDGNQENTPSTDARCSICFNVWKTGTISNPQY